ncbi:MAG TPA: SIMPL domain-containing protein [Acidimicrobiales bacterium]|nr:SIMPL domain-containing protein [Acidimicrobiales bacterium]
MQAAKSSIGKPARVAGVVVAMMTAGVLAAACSSSPKPAAAKPSCGGSSSKLTVQGTGLASGKPDLLTVSVGINVTDPTAKAALADNNAKATAVIDALGLSGSAAKDVQTSDVTIDPQYNLKGVITGYQVSNNLTAKLRNFTTAGSVIDALAAAAGNAIRLDSIAFSVQDTRPLEDQARNDAVHQAVSHAQAMAQSAGERLGPVCSLTDQSQIQNFSGSFRAADQAQGAPLASASAIPLAPGSQQETAQVTMVYSLLPASHGR